MELSAELLHSTVASAGPDLGERRKHVRAPLRFKVKVIPYDDGTLGEAEVFAAAGLTDLFLAYPIETRQRGKVRVVGRPIPSRTQLVSQQEAREVFELPQDGVVLGVFGALAGAATLNEFVVDTWGERGPAILHQTGKRDYELVKKRVRRPDYRVIDETDRFAVALTACDLVLARAGGSVWEIAAAGRPAIFVPYPFATGDHQARNAEHFVRAGGAIMVRELDLADVPELVRSLLDDPERRAKMSEAMLRVARPDAAAEIADELIAMAKKPQ